MRVMLGGRRAVAAAILWIATAALVIVTLTNEGDVCHPSGWRQLSWVVVAFLAAGAMFASLRASLTVKLAASAVVGVLAGGGFWFLLVAQWVGACTE
jgi:hypothetical protein